MPLSLALVLLLLHQFVGAQSQLAKGHDDECDDIVREVVRAAAAAAALDEAENEAADAMLHSTRLPRGRATQQPLSRKRESLAPVHIDVQLAQATRVATSAKLLSPDDIALVRIDDSSDHVGEP